MGKDLIYYGWIPNLSGNVFLLKVDDLLERMGYVKKKEGVYSKRKRISDLEQDDDCNIVLEFPSKFESRNPENELVFSISELKTKAICRIKKNGFLSIDLIFADSFPIKADYIPVLALTIYQEVKDIFHEHTHHNKEVDKLISPVKSRSEEEAIEDIIAQYQVKIIDYHLLLKGHLLREGILGYLWRNLKKFVLVKYGVIPATPPSIPFAAQAKGEMLYAIMFINLFLEKTNADYEKYSFIFNNAYNSISALSNEISQMLQDYSNRLMLILTFLLVILTLVLIWPRPCP
jgi:hypothetical protein